MQFSRPNSWPVQLGEVTRIGRNESEKNKLLATGIAPI